MTQTTVALLGTGIMGAAMGRNLLRAGFAVTVYNRTAEKARPLEADGARVASTPVDAVRDADVVVTMLADGFAVEHVMHDGGALEAMRPDALWIQMSTVGPEATDRFASMASDVRVGFVDAPVLGTKQPAEKGELLVLVAADHALEPRCRGVFAAVGKKTSWVGNAPGRASRLKLVINTWVVGLVGLLAETLAVAEALDVLPNRFLEAIDGGPLGPAYAQIKGRAMLDHAYPVSFPLRLALKDARLVLETAGRAGLEARITQAVADAFERALEAGHGDDDMAAIFEGIRPSG